MAIRLHALGFLDLSSLTLQIAQIVELSTANLTLADNLNVIYTGGMHGESTLNADTVGNTADGERLTDAAIALGDNSTFKRLQTLAATFNYLHENANGVTDVELGHIGAELSLIDGTNDLTHFMGLLPS